MSVVSSRSSVSTVASILKTKTGKNKANGTKLKVVHFQLPKDFNRILENFENGTDRKSYEAIASTMANGNITSEQIVDLMKQVKPCISKLTNDLSLMVNSLLQINWMNKSKEATDAYKDFLEDLICVHTYHCKLVIDKLVYFLRVDDKHVWVDGKPSPEDLVMMNHIHDVFIKFLKVVPMSSTILLQSLKNNYPYYTRPTYLHQAYLYFLFKIIDYAPQLRADIISTIMEKITHLDVNIPRMEIENYREDSDDEEVFKLESEQGEGTVREHPHAHSLDMSMDMFMTYIYDFCHPGGTINLENVKKIYFELLQSFEKTVLHTYAPHHVQFIMFYLCSFKTGIAEAFLNWLWQKITNPNVAPVIRQLAISYVASLLARGNFITLTLLTGYLQEMTNWIHSYIASQDSLESANSDVRAHTVFYSMCQAVFYVVAFKSRDLTSTKKNLMFLQSLNFTKIVSCRLNPLRACLPVVVQHFATVTRTYQLAYCYSIMEHNARSNLPVVQTTSKFVKRLDTFFPFDPYVLLKSSKKIKPLYLEYQGANTEPAVAEDESNDQENDEDDFMDVSYPHDSVSPHMEKFSYSSSPGFIHA